MLQGSHHLMMPIRFYVGRRISSGVGGRLQSHLTLDTYIVGGFCPSLLGNYGDDVIEQDAE